MTTQPCAKCALTLCTRVGLLTSGAGGRWGGGGKKKVGGGRAWGGGVADYALNVSYTECGTPTNLPVYTFSACVEFKRIEGPSPEQN